MLTSLKNGRGAGVSSKPRQNSARILVGRSVPKNNHQWRSNVCDSDTVKSIRKWQHASATPLQLTMFETPGKRTSRKGTGPTSSRLHTGNPVGFEVMVATLTGYYGQSGDPLVSEESSSRVRLTSSEICMCTDYSRPLLGQITHGLPGECGASFSGSSVGPRCVGCGLVRPYRITALSTL